MNKKQNVIRLVSSRDKKWDGKTERRIKDRRKVHDCETQARVKLVISIIKLLIQNSS